MGILSHWALRVGLLLLCLFVTTTIQAQDRDTDDIIAA